MVRGDWLLLCLQLNSLAIFLSRLLLTSLTNWNDNFVQSSGGNIETVNGHLNSSIGDCSGSHPPV